MSWDQFKAIYISRYPFTHQEINVHPSGMISRDLRRHAAPAVISIKSENKMIAYSEDLLGII